MQYEVKFRTINRSEAFDELGSVDGIPAGLRGAVHQMIDQIDGDKEIEVSISGHSDAEGGTATLTVIALGPPKTSVLTREQRTVMRAEGRAINV